MAEIPNFTGGITALRSIQTSLVPKPGNNVIEKSLGRGRNGRVFRAKIAPLVVYEIKTVVFILRSLLHYCG